MRISARRLALPAAALAAALTLTACQSSDPDTAAPTAEKPPLATSAPAPAPTSAGPTPTAPRESAPTTAPPAATTPASATPAPARTTAARPTAGTPTARPTDDGPVRRTCAAGDVKVVASKVSRPINHLALTVTNIGGRPCDAVGAPLVGFDDSQAPIRIVEESKPQAVVTLMPRESAYASLILTGEPGGDTHGTTVRTIKVNLTTDSMVTVAAPEGTYVDDGAAVSYWQRELEDALQY
ncbi:DUF4232 domain-containing protein [Streptomyces sp. NPDC058052]|uniref:DUF4232 domain-containing protein n=1 Tax=Streptomyces sp. NPDC058052 TaxID=3346316 RepID=UPI0036EB9170